MSSLIGIETDVLKDMISEVVSLEVNKALAKLKNEEVRLTAGIENEETILSNEEVCSMLKIKVTALHWLRKSGKLPFMKANRRILYRKSDVLDYIKSGYNFIPEPHSN